MGLKWEGVMPAVTTKFTDKDTLDIDMFEVNIQSFLPKDRKELNSVFLPVSSLSEVCELVLSIKNPGQ